MQIIQVINDERGFRYWLKHYPRLSATLRVDTGLSTFGIDWREVPGLWARYAKSDTSLTTLMSHLAAENKADIQKSLQQKMRFDHICRRICAKEGSLAASGGALLGPVFHYDLVRSGLYLLGFEIDPNRPDITVPSATLDAAIIAIRDVRKGESIGYDLDCKAQAGRISIEATSLRPPKAAGRPPPLGSFSSSAGAAPRRHRRPQMQLPPVGHWTHGAR